MSLVVTLSGGEYLFIDDSLPDWSGGFTWLVWARVDDDPGNQYQGLYSIYITGGSTYFCWESASNGFTSVSALCYVNSQFRNINMGGISSGVWYCFVLVYNYVSSSSATMRAAIYDANGVISGPTESDGIVPGTIQAASWITLGDIVDWGEHVNASFGPSKFYTRVLSTAEIENEVYNILPQSTEDLYGWWPTFPGSSQRDLDLSGNDHFYEESGTITESNNPPIGWGGAHLTFVMPSGVTFQYLRPSSDSSLGSWTDDDGGTTNIYTTIDEVTADDNDYVQSPNNPSTNVYKVKVQSGNDPGVHTDHQVSYRYKKSSTTGSVTLKVRLVEGTTTRKEWTHTNISDSWVTQQQTLSDAEAAAITDYTNLYLEFEATAT